MAHRARRLADADKMFQRFFDRWHDEHSRKLKEFKGTRPDMMEVSELVGRSMTEACPITEEGASVVLTQIQDMRSAACGDWPRFLSVREPIDVDWIAKFDRYYTRARIEGLLKTSDPTDFSNDYLVSVCEFGAVLGSVMIDLLPRVYWLPSWPYWESAILDPKTGFVIPVFHWAIKKFSTYGIDDEFDGKLQACVQMLRDGLVK